MGAGFGRAWGSIQSRSRALQATKPGSSVVGVAGAIPPDVNGPFLWTLTGAGAARVCTVYRKDGTVYAAATLLAQSTVVLVAQENPLVAVVTTLGNATPVDVWWTRNGGTNWSHTTFTGHPLLPGGANGDRQKGVCLSPDGRWFYLLTTGYNTAGFGCVNGADRLDRVDTVNGTVVQGWKSDAAGGVLTFPPLDGSGWATQCYQALTADNAYVYVHRTQDRENRPVAYCGGNPAGGVSYAHADGSAGAGTADLGAICRQNEDGGTFARSARNSQGHWFYHGSTASGLAGDTPVLRSSGGTLTSGVANDVVDTYASCLSPSGKIALGFYNGFGVGALRKVARSTDGGSTWSTRQVGDSSAGSVGCFGYPFDPETYYCEWYASAMDGRGAGDFVRRRWSDGAYVDTLFNLASPVAAGARYAATSDGAPSMPL